jgi:hypothetical protein
MNRLGIPSKGTSFCLHCFKFEEMDVQVIETEQHVEVVLTCGCGDVQMISEKKSEFFEYEEDFTPGHYPAAAGKNFSWKNFANEKQ